MSSPTDTLSIGDWVVLTKTGAREHRDYYKNSYLTGGALAGAVMLPLVLPGAFLASVGIASAGVGIAVTGTTQLVVGAASGAGILSFISEYLEKHPEAEAIGIVKDRKERWWGQSGYDYKVVWSNEEPFGESSWHLGIHLNKINLPFEL